MLTAAILGLGNRGRIYGKQLFKNPNVKITAICEKNPQILEFWRQKFGLNSEQAFVSDAGFFASGKLADVLVVATQDRDHYYHAKSALNIGYELLLEKPVSPVWEECSELAQIAAEKKLRVVVCHVLRYSAFYDKIKSVIDSGAIGDVLSVNITENVGYWHFSHSYVRGNWRNEAIAGPSILAKCCHDLDMIYYFTGKKCQSVFSTAARRVYCLQNRPQGAADFCADCKVGKNCAYQARKIYWGVTRHTLPFMIFHKTLVTGKAGASIKELKNALKTSPYGRCVYNCDNDVVESQNVTLKLADGVWANLTMTAFSKKWFRRLYICGTKGEIMGNDTDGKFRLNIFGGPSKTVKAEGGGMFSHLGGDKQIVRDFVEYITTGVKAPKLSTIDVTLESHKVAFAAEKSRNSGKSVDLLPNM